MTIGLDKTPTFSETRPEIDRNAGRLHFGMVAGFTSLPGRNKSESAGRPQIETELPGLIRQMSTENLLWGAPRIHGVNEEAYQPVFNLMEQDRVDSLIVSDESEHFPYRATITELAAKSRIPAIYHIDYLSKLAG
jgi:hypothetical protein